MKRKVEKIENVPTWALCYIVNGDTDAITDQEQQEIDQWLHDNRVEIISPIENEDCEWDVHFTWCPAFGSATDCVDCNVIRYN